MFMYYMNIQRYTQRLLLYEGDKPNFFDHSAVSQFPDSADVERMTLTFDSSHSTAYRSKIS